jgi:hypothetical protein
VSICAVVETLRSARRKTAQTAVRLHANAPARTTRHAFALAFALLLAVPPTYLGGRTLRFGPALVIAIPVGWYRAAPDAEQETESFVLLYTGRSFDEEPAEPRGYVHVKRDIDELGSPEEVATFYANAAKQLTEAGWKTCEITLHDGARPCFVIDDDESTTFLVQLPFGNRSVTTYTLIPQRSASMPDYAQKLLEGISLK